MKDNHSLDLSQFPKELKLLLLIIKQETNQNVLMENKELFSDVNWDKFLHLVRHHRVYPIIHKRIKEIGKGLFPKYIIHSLHDEYNKNTFRMLHLSGETGYLSKILMDNNIRALFLKGPILGSCLYGEISLRTSTDLDLMVSINDLACVERIIQELGYIKDDYIVSVLNDWKWRHHHFAYFHPEKRVKLEIHWRLNPGPAKEPNFNELWGRKRKSLLSSSSPVYMLGEEDLFLFLVLHGARHGWSRIRWLVDIDQLTKQIKDWRKIIVILKQYQSITVGGQALYLASQILNTPISGNIKMVVTEKKAEKLAQEALFYIKQMVNLHSEPLPESVAKYHKNHLFSLMSSQQKILFIMSFLYPYHVDFETLPLPKFLHFLYFPLRPFLFAWRKTKKQAIQ
jgi:hypothetical protein